MYTYNYIVQCHETYKIIIGSKRNSSTYMYNFEEREKIEEKELCTNEDYISYR